MNRLTILTGFVLLVLGGCNDTDTPFVLDDSTGTDPYCNAITDWAEEINVTASYTDTADKDQVEIALTTVADVVEISGVVTITGGTVSLILSDKPDLYLVLVPEVDDATITITGTVDCANLGTGYMLTLTLDPESDTIETDLVIVEETPDGGVEDAGVAADSGDNSL